MNTPAPTPETRAAKLQSSLARALVLGVLISASVITLGIVLHLAHHATDPVALSTYRAQPPELSRFGGIIKESISNPRAIMQLGIALLILTPIARVFFSLVIFATQRDRLYAAISAVVLILLLAGFI
jgi:uncharacterized membrane protein